MSTSIVDTQDAISKLVDDIVNATRTPLLFVDLEGINLSREGSISIIQVLVPPAPVVHLVDVFRLQEKAFETIGTSQKTFKDILQSEAYVKIFFDVRNDSDALFSHFAVDLSGVIDLQLVEYASRPRAGRFIKGLAKCISENYYLSPSERQKWTLVKETGQKLFAPEKGGSYSVFNERPLPDALKDYCVQDVMMLPKLLSTYAAKLQTHMAAQVLDESQRRVAQSQGLYFNGNGSHMALAPVFRWTRPASEPLLKSPLDILCSRSLSDCCVIQAIEPVLATGSKTSCGAFEPPGSLLSNSVSNTHPSTMEMVQQLQKLRVVDNEAEDGRQEEDTSKGAGGGKADEE